MEFHDEEFEINENLLPAELLDAALSELEKHPDLTGVRGIRNAVRVIRLVREICAPDSVAEMFTVTCLVFPSW